MRVGKARIDVQAGDGGTIELDGVDVSAGVAGFRLSGRMNEFPRLELDLLLRDRGEAEATDVRYEIPPVTHDLLVLLGWTPPDAAPNG